MKNQKYSNLIQLSAESIGIKSLDNEIMSYLNTELEEKTKLILSYSQKLMRVCKRTTLKIDDISNTLKFFNFGELIGYDPFEITEYEKIENIKGLWRLKQNIVDVDDYLSKPMAICPMGPFPHFYWFALDGKRPEIPENFIRVNDLNLTQKSQSQYLMSLDQTPDNMAPITSSKSVAENNCLLNDKEQSVLKEEEKNRISNISYVIHNMNKELQIYFENFQQKFLNEIKDNNYYLKMNKNIENNISVLQNNPGIVELLPHILSFLMNVYENYKTTKIYFLICFYVNAIINNTYFFIEPYLDKLFILLISFILMDINECAYIDPLVKVKFLSIFILKKIIRTYSIKYNNLPYLIEDTLISKFKLEDENLGLTNFGVVEGIKMLGPIFIKRNFIDRQQNNVKKYISDFEKNKEHTNYYNKLKYNMRPEEISDENITQNSALPLSNIDALNIKDLSQRRKILLFHSLKSFQNSN